jgi:hypothetical protein
MTDIYNRRLTPWFLFVQAFSTFTARWKRVLGLGCTITAVTIVTDTLLDSMFDESHDNWSGLLGFSIAATAVALTAANGFGTTFLSGVLDRTVGEHQHGHPNESLWELLRRIPYVWLILADLLALVLKVIGFVLLVIPGLAAVTLLCVTGPVVMVEGCRPFSAVRRSAQLVWPYFWLAFVAVTIPIFFEAMVSDWIATADWAHGFLPHLVSGVVVEAPIAIFVSLVEVTLAYHLMERDRPGHISGAHHG